MGRMSENDVSEYSKGYANKVREKRKAGAFFDKVLERRVEGEKNQVNTPRR